MFQYWLTVVGHIVNDKVHSKNGSAYIVIVFVDLYRI